MLISMLISKASRTVADGVRWCEQSRALTTSFLTSDSLSVTMSFSSAIICRSSGRLSRFRNLSSVPSNLRESAESREHRAESRVAVNGVTSQSRHTLPSLLSARCWSIRDSSSNVKKKIKTPANPKDFLSTPITISHCGLLPQRHWIDMEASSSLVQYKTHSFIFEFSFYWFLIEPHRMGSLHMLRDPLLDPPSK